MLTRHLRPEHPKRNYGLSGFPVTSGSPRGVPTALLKKNGLSFK